MTDIMRRNYQETARPREVEETMNRLSNPKTAYCDPEVPQADHREESEIERAMRNLNFIISAGMSSIDGLVTRLAPILPSAEKIVAEEYPLRTSAYSCQLAEDLDNKYWRIVDIVETINNIVMDLKL